MYVASHTYKCHGDSIRHVYHYIRDTKIVLEMLIIACGMWGIVDMFIIGLYHFICTLNQSDVTDIIHSCTSQLTTVCREVKILGL